ncbi:helix-turn-helix domain-containing protein [Okeania sp. SIO3I5]
MTKLNQLFGCCRFVWNQSLAYSGFHMNKPQ